MKVLALADVSLYPQRGQFQLVVREVRPAGVGELELAFQQLKEKLAKEGLFAEERKRPVPLFPFRVGVVTSRQAAALRDFMIVSRRRNPAVRILVAPARVQGEGAAAEIARGIERLNTIKGLDCIVITRGGGSLEDLWPFNEEVVARAVAASALPVISAVGHETDWTISDMVADLRMPTPSAAAERVAWPREEWVARIIEQRDRMGRVIRIRVQGLMQQVGWFTRAHGFQVLGIRLREATQQLDEALRRLPVGFRHRLEVAGRDLLSAEERMRSASVSALERRERQLNQLLRTVNALSPVQVLERGYAIARRPKGGPVVRSAAELEPGVPLEVYLREGMAEVRVEDTGPGLERMMEPAGDPASEEG
jgi:exodeoxyribonuclease VII large subunit